MTCVDHGWVPCTTNTTPGGFDEQWFQKGGLKGALVVVFAVFEVVIINFIEQSEQRQRARKAKDKRFQRLLISFNTDSCCSFTIAFKSIVVEASRSTFAFSVMPSAKSVSK